MDYQPDTQRDLVLLEKIEQNPDASQASLAAQLGVAVGTVNWHLKRLIYKGYVKVHRAERRKLRYIITAEGIALRTHLTIDFIQNSFILYRQTRARVKELIKQVHQEGYQAVRIIGEGDIADICRLTCIEQSINIVNDGKVPALEVYGLKVVLNMDGKIDERERTPNG
jgi:DNA-binding MarR family transcriptional regulator